MMIGLGPGVRSSVTDQEGKCESRGGWDVLTPLVVCMDSLVGMCIGEKRRLTIPSGMGYGDHGAPPSIPGGATLVFEVELLKITRPGRSDL
jgi:hypothetical protein